LSQDPLQDRRRSTPDGRGGVPADEAKRGLKGGEEGESSRADAPGEEQEVT
ncbi:unnamed protein product, partial [Amoebophrya sp. A25]